MHNGLVCVVVGSPGLFNWSSASSLETSSEFVLIRPLESIYNMVNFCCQNTKDVYLKKRKIESGKASEKRPKFA